MPIYNVPGEQQTIFADLAQFLAQHEVAGWAVGGWVRDLLLGKPGNDIDVAVDGAALPLARIFADHTGGAFVQLDDATETARIVWKTDPATLTRPLLMLDLVRLRALTIEADLAARDFTINALAVPLQFAQKASFQRDQILDPIGGLHDLDTRLVRQAAPTALADDPLRMLRAARFAAQLGFSIAPETDATLRAHVAHIDRVAVERVRDELLKLLAARHAAPWLSYLDDARLLTRIIPELEAARNCTQPPEHFLPVLAHLFETVTAWEWLYAQINGLHENIEATEPFWLPQAVKTYPDLAASLPFAERILGRMEADVGGGQQRYALFKLATLLHDVAKPQTKAVRPDGRITFYGHDALGAEVAATIGQRLRLGREAAAYLRLIVGEHMRPGQLRGLGAELTRRAVYRLLRDTREAAPDVLLHSLCDGMAVRGPYLSRVGWDYDIAWTAAILREAWGEKRQQQDERLITGKDVIEELQVAPGPVIGRVLAAVQEAHFLGEVQTRAEALALAARLIQAEGDTPATND